MFAILLSPVALSGPALAKWSAPMTVAGSVEPTSPSTAVNARGDLVIAWAHAGRVSSGRHPHVTVAVHVATRSWGTARYRDRER
jgi:hypothetical protein